ncbi:MAG: hypothetical protein AVDCRST_MAG42-820 [uncultured Chthoniobacterales bacterium]|uniref:General secretion pathway protein M n=1 Tax=uncultured Chthoniobacterales bacterium TaxID=1836801 RepID=A0A6J4H0F2_9BACT|nr:MAG: hypothetical protein AVDCRST_MAG42-820 [uncultured Chthoniobacterales bacterium]
MMPAFIQRMNRRERVLSMLVGGALFLLVNWLIWSWLMGSLAQTRTDLATRKAARTQQSLLLKERSMWEKREAWLKKQQPTLAGPGEASTLLDQVGKIAGKHNVLVENPNLGGVEATPTHQSTSVSVETKSPWQPLVRFLHDVQQPEAFVVFESVNLAIEPSDPTMMRGKFKIARWFAPKT